MARNLALAFGLAALVAGEAFAAEDFSCGAFGDPPAFATAGFYRGDNELIGNAFAVAAKPRMLCDAKNSTPLCAGNSDRRVWEVTMVTAAHVLQDVCRGASGRWADDSPGTWRPSRLSFVSNDPVDASTVANEAIDPAWCSENQGALTAYIDHNIDLYIFKQVIHLPRRSVVIPFTVQMLPNLSQTPRMGSIIGLEPTGAVAYTTLYAAGQGAKNPLYYVITPAQLPPQTSSQSAYSLEVSVAKAQSGSPIGYCDDKGRRCAIFGVVTETGAIDCNQTGLVDAKTADTGDTDLKTMQLQHVVGCSRADVQSTLARSYRTAKFVALAREPSWFGDYVDELGWRGDILGQLWRARTEAGDDENKRIAFAEAARNVFLGLTPLEQIMLGRKLETSGAGSVLTAICPHLEPEQFKPR